MDSIRHARYQYTDYRPPYPVYSNNQIAGIAQNMLLLQNPDGGWPKNIDWLCKMDDQAVKVITSYYQESEGQGLSTFDNYSTYSHIEYLAQVYQQIADPRYKSAIERGIEWILGAQHPESGGFTGSDVDAITFNDDVMSGVLTTLNRIATDDELFGFLPINLRAESRTAYHRGIACILRTQIRTSTGRLTAWGQQHDHSTFQPIAARSYEPASITANETVGILRLLMAIEKPSPEIITAIQSACTWLDEVRIEGKRLTRISAEPATLHGRYSDYENVLEDRPAAPSLWARFYHTETFEPLFYDRDGTKTTSYNQLSRERRVGYGYLGGWPAQLLTRDYPAWKRLHGL